MNRNWILIYVVPKSKILHLTGITAKNDNYNIIFKYSYQCKKIHKQ